MLKYTLILLMSIPMLMQAQIKMPSASPRITKDTKVGYVAISIDYGQPGVKGREVFGGLEPFGKVWRTGANASTKISFDGEVKLGGQTIPAGVYALYTIPYADKWTIIISKTTDLWGAGGYDPANDFVRVDVPVTTIKESKETFDIYLSNYNLNGADLVLECGTTRVIVPIAVDSESKIYEEIELAMASKEEIKAQTYFDASKFYFSKGKDLKKVSKWLEKAADLRPEAFWYNYLQAEVALSLKDYKTAKKRMKVCLSKAKESKKGDYGYIAKCALLKERIKEAKK